MLIALLALGLIALVQVPTLLARRSLDPGVNEHTGLPDGTYALVPTASMHDGNACWFRGPVRGQPEAREITVAGTGPVQCAGRGDHVGRVIVSVVGGRATIVRAAGY